ncbi:5-formyltetrahydrofolate cyclo-ligase [Flavobacteriaceae bacterium]|jgi:5-formyltetrahydrofolate cyclo-ligase|nr:5-formyltetrahydrofolate cyclo-ligase [Flavobacteriaceae bacterium]
MTKADLRIKYKSLRGNVSTAWLNEKSLAIANQLLTLNIWDKSFYHLFLTIVANKEVNTDYILNILSGKDKHIVISKSNFKTVSLDNYLLTDSTKIKLNHWNIPEPVDGIKIDNSKIEIVFVPLFCFDSQGHRVGYGKGFYDNFLNNCDQKILKIGLSLFKIEGLIDDIHEGDIALDICVTPSKIHYFK